MREIWDALVRWWMPEPIGKIEALDLRSIRAADGVYSIEIPGIARRVEFDGGDLGKGGIPETYAVSGKPRAVPWHIRKRELEAQHKTKRRQREQFREEA